MDTKSYAIFGGTGGGGLIADFLKAHKPPPKILGFLNDQHSRGQIVEGLPVLGSFSDWASLPETVKFVAPLHSAKKMYERARIVQNLGIPDKRWGTAVHPVSDISPRTTIRPGSSVGPFAHLQANVSLGKHLAARSGCVIGHDCVLEDFVFVGSHVALSGYCTVGTGVFLGHNSAVRPNIHLGKFSVIGMGSVVTKNVPDYAIVAGVPARIIGEVERLDDGNC